VSLQRSCFWSLLFAVKPQAISQSISRRVVVISEAEVTVLTPLVDQRVVEKAEVRFECVVSKADKSATWTKQDKPIAVSDRIQISVDGGTRHLLVIKSALLDDQATYKVQIDSASSAAKLIVDGQFRRIKTDSLNRFITLISFTVYF